MPPELLIYFSIEYGTYQNEPAAAWGFKHAKHPLILVHFNYSLRTLSRVNLDFHAPTQPSSEILLLLLLASSSNQSTNERHKLITSLMTTPDDEHMTLRRWKWGTCNCAGLIENCREGTGLMDLPPHLFFNVNIIVSVSNYLPLVPAAVVLCNVNL